ncbi:MAG: DUF1778 domain-containing protein [Planctomycetia bacterium]|nr:DUF1778 domain-containing protein [Planctomycetia bacterium]
MGKTRTNGAAKAASPSPLMVRLDEESKSVLTRAAELRGISVSDYVRQVTVAQARKEVTAATEQTIAMTPEEQLAFWTALSAPAKLTAAQKKLGKLMRGES